MTRRSGPLAGSVAMLALSAHGWALAQDADTGIGSAKDPEEIVITGQRWSAARDTVPIATLDSDAIGATGASNMSELLRAIRPVTQSADGSEPIFLLNAQRTSGYEEIGSLPPEAIDKVEVLPEPAALKYGFPPTRRVLNFITKRSFRQVELRGATGSAMRGGSETGNANLGLTQLRRDGRLTIALERRHTGKLLQSERDLTPDPDTLFDSIGNVRGLNGGEIDPALSALTGQVVTVAPVPDLLGDRKTLAGYAQGANKLRLFDVGPFRSLVPHNDAVKAEAVLGNRIGETLGGSLSLSAERSRDRTLTGPAVAVLTVPASHPLSPFAGPVQVYRYLTEADPLRQRQTTTKLKAGTTLRGSLAGWRWDLTSAFDQQSISGFNERGIDLTAANAAIGAGANPFDALDPGLLANRLVDRGELRTRGMNVKTVVNKSPLRLPAGEVTVTGTVEAARSDARSQTRGANPFDLQLARNRIEAGVAVDAPIASKQEDVLSWAGELSVNASAAMRRISSVGTLHDRSVGLNYTPVRGVQLQLQHKASESPPGLEQLASPEFRILNTGVFDYATGGTEFVTLFQGGNPDLLPESRRVRSIGLNIKPLGKGELRIGATYEDTLIRDQTGTIYALPPEFEALLPDRFVRDEAGKLIEVSFQPTNFYRQRQHSLKLTLAAYGQIGKAPAEAGDKGPERPRYWGGIGPTFRFSDRLQLRRGTQTLDILAGDTITGGGTSRITSYYYGGVSYKGMGFNIDGWFQSRGRVRNDNPAADLTFAPVFKLNMTGYVGLGRLLKDQAWARKLELRTEVSNVTDARQRVRDGNGRTPHRFQPDFIDPVGRTVKLTVRKLL